MMTFPLDGGAALVVIEPGNIHRLKQGKPLRVGEVLIAYTPDMQYFAELLGANGKLPEKGEQRIECGLHLSPEQIDSALKLALHYGIYIITKGTNMTPPTTCFRCKEPLSLLPQGN